MSVNLRRPGGKSETGGKRQHGMAREVSWNGGSIVWPLKDMLNLPKSGGKKQYMRLNSVIQGGMSRLHFLEMCR